MDKAEESNDIGTDLEILELEVIDSQPIADGYIDHQLRGRFVQIIGQPKSLTYFAAKNPSDDENPTPAIILRDIIVNQKKAIDKLSAALKMSINSNYDKVVNPKAIAENKSNGIFKDIPKIKDQSENQKKEKEKEKEKETIYTGNESLTINGFKEIVMFTKEQLCVQSQEN